MKPKDASSSQRPTTSSWSTSSSSTCRASGSTRRPGLPPRRGAFEDGIGFDGSSIRGWQPINASDMLMMPDPTTAKIDPFTAQPTLSSSATSSTRSPRSPTAATRATSRRRPRRTSLRRASPTPSTSAPRPSSSSSTTSASTTRSQRGLLLRGRLKRGRLELRQRGPEPRLQDPLQGGLLPRPADRHAPWISAGDDAMLRRRASRSRSATTRSRRAASARSA
jgi:hypothetical protein